MTEDAPPALQQTSIGVQLIAAAFCIGVPALITMIAPIAHLKFEKQAHGVTATTQKFLLMVVPFRTEVISPVTEVTEHVIQGHRDKKGNKSEDEGSLEIKGPQATAKISVSPVNLASVNERVQAFLKAPTDQPLQMTVVANWKFSVFVGGLATAFAALYVVAVFVGWVRWVLRTFGPGELPRDMDAGDARVAPQD